MGDLSNSVEFNDLESSRKMGGRRRQWLVVDGVKHTRIRFHIDILPKSFLQSIFGMGLIGT